MSEKYIPYGRQDISQEDIDAVVSTLKSDWLTQGPTVTKFEQALADYTGAKFAVATCNATMALHLACRALGVGSGDIVWTSPNTFLASANCARYCGADVDFVDIDAKTYNLCVKKLADKLALAKQQNCLPKVVIPVHFAGQSCDMAAIFQLSKQYGFRIIEDASHAVGGEYQGKKVGSGEYSDITIFSFHPVKIITTGEGGMALTNSAELAEKMRLLVSHGMMRDATKLQDCSQGAWYYEQADLGYNYRITDLQCALGLSQLGRLPAFIERRQVLAQRYHEKLSALPLQLPYVAKECLSAFHLYVVCLNDPALRTQVFAGMREAGIGVNVHYIPVHTQPYYRQLGFKWGDFPEAEAYYHAAITLPLFATLTDADQDYVVQTLTRLLQ